MAALNRDTGQSCENRGQLILIAALVLALIFVALALVVNSAIFTENLATRADVPGSDDALEYRYDVIQSLGTAIEYVNVHHNANKTALRENANASIGNISEFGGIQQATMGSVVTVSHADDFEFGDRVAQTGARNFTNATAADDWTVAADVNRTRNFEINVTDRTSLSDTDPFRLNVTDGDTDWTMEIGSDGTNVTVDVEHPGVGETCTRSDPDDPFIVDVTGGTVAGEPCHALSQNLTGESMWFGTGVDEGYDIRFENGENIEGQYSFVLRDGNVQEGDLPAAAEVTEAIYSLDVRYEYHTPMVTYETDIRVAPGEVPE